MCFSKLFSTLKVRQKQHEKECITNGYSTTTEPAIPDIMKFSVECKIIKTEDRQIGITMTHEGVDLVKSKSLELIRGKLLEWFSDCQTMKNNLYEPFSKNTLSISTAFPNFEVGESCLEVKLRNGVKAPEGAFFTYRKLSECVQCTYFNANGIEYLAGICFYPAPHGKPKLLKSNGALLNLILFSYVPYPLQDRRECWIYRKHKFYGRFCETCGRHVLINFNDGIPFKFDFDHYTKSYTFSLCKECMENHFMCKWEEPDEAARIVSAEICLPTTKILTDTLTKIPETTPFATIASSFDSVLASEQHSSSESLETSPSRSISTESLLDTFEQINDTALIDSELNDGG